MSSIPQDLIVAVRNGSLIPFVGAGLSLSVGHDLFPSWKDLIERFAARLDREAQFKQAKKLRELCTQGEFPQAAENAVAALTKPRFVEEMQRAFDVPRPRGANLSAVEALWRLKPRLVITTNYDSVLEWPSMAPGNSLGGRLEVPEPTLIHNDDPALLRDAAAGLRTFVWHLHGSIRRPDTLILTQTQYRRLYGSSSEQYKLYQFARERLRHLLASRPLLFVGFSFQDAFVQAQIREILDLTSRTSPVSFILVREKEVDDASLLAEYQVQRIEFKDFGTPMVERLIEIGRAAWGDQYAARIGPEPAPGMAQLIGELESILRNVVLEPAQVTRAFNAARPPAWEPLPLFGDRRELLIHSIVQLGATVRQGEDGPFPLLEFVRSILPHSPTVIRSELIAWRKAAAAALARDETDRKRLIRGFPRQVPDSDSYVLVRVATETSGRFRAQAWLFTAAIPYKLFQDERECCTHQDFSVLVNDVLGTLEALAIDAEKSMLAFLLPRSLLVEAVDQWQPSALVAELPIGATHTVGVRSLERLSCRTCMTRLRNTWKSFQAAGASGLTMGNLTNPAGCAGYQAVWLSAEDGSRPGIIQELTERKVVCAVLAGAPPADPPERDLLNAVLQAGIPIVLWARDLAGHDAMQARARFESLLARTPVRKLAEEVRRDRRQAADGPDPYHPGRYLALMWDDPERLPPDQDQNNRAVVLRS